MKPIRVYNKQLNMLTETDNYLSLQFNPRFYEVGEFELHINQYVEGAEYFVKGNLIVLDKRKDKAMLIRHREIALDQSGKVTENWRVTGVTLKGVLDQRVTIPPESTSHDRKSGNAETVMKHYVDKHFVNPADSARKIDYIEIAEDQGRGVQVEWESRYKNVADELTAISKQANLGWIMYADIENKKWIFDVVEPRDVTQGNEAGLQPVFFSPDFSTIKTQQFVDSDNNYKNVGFVGGQGEGVERKIVKIGEAEGMGLHEVFIDARDVSETDEETEEELSDEEYEQLLIERGERRMREFETTFYLEAQILTPSINRSNDFAMSTPFEYEKDFRLGDLVEVFNKKWNITMNAPITEFTEIHEPSGFILESIFGEAQPTLITKIRDKFNELEGIEKQELPARLAVERMRDAMQYGDERLSEEEQARIEQALEILDESKEYADEEAYQVEQEAKRYADDQDIVYDEEAKRDASEKSDQARDDAKNHADEQDDIVRDDAARDATDKADRAEDNAKGHADDRADEAERNAKDYTDENAVDRGTYEDKMQEIADDLADKAGIEYVDGQLQFKADSDVVQGIDDTVSDLQGTASDLQQAVNDHADALADQDGRIVDVETDLDTVEGNLSVAITDLSNLDDTVSQQGIDIGANATAISLKASQDDLDTVSGDVSSLSGSLDVLAGEVSAKAERSIVEGLQDELEELEVGGRNFVINSDFSNGSSNWRIYEDENAEFINNTVILSGRSGGIDAVYQSVFMPQGDFDPNGIENHSISIWVKGIGILRARWGASSGNIIDNHYVESENYIKVSGTFSDTGNGNIIISLVGEGELTIDRIQVERGTKATDWTPAPEDIDTQFETVTNDLAELIVNVDGISADVSSLSQTVTDHGTDISDLSAEINVQAGRIDERVSISEYETDQDGVITRLDDAEATISNQGDMIDQRVTETTFDALEGRVDSAESAITQHADEISSKVEADDVRSIFTQEAGSFTFDADQINFEGHVFGEDATFSGRVEGAIITGSAFDARAEDGYSNVQLNGDNMIFREADSTGVLRDIRYGYRGITYGEYPSHENIPFTFDMDEALFTGDILTNDGSADIIVDEGSNIDGHYVRYANGIQICWSNHIYLPTDVEIGVLARTANPITWQFPVSFNASYPISVSATVASTGRWGDISSTPNATGVNLIAYSPYSPSDSEWLTTAVAIGRWK